MREGKLRPRPGYVASPGLRSVNIQCFLGGRTRPFPERGKETARYDCKNDFYHRSYILKVQTGGG